MKKMMCIFVLLAFIGSTVIMTGCGGSSGGFSWVAAALVITAIATTGGASGVAFAASTRENIRFQSGTTTYVAEVYLNDELKVTVDAARDDDDFTILRMSESVRIDNLPHGGHEYKVVFRRRDAANSRGLTVVGYEDLTGGDNIKTPEATPLTTGKAILYQQWKNVQLAAAGSNFREFSTIAESSSTVTAGITALENDVKTDLKAVMVDNTATSFTTAENEAKNITVPAPEPVAPAANLEGLYKFVDDGEDLYFVVKKSGEDYYAGVANGDEQNPITSLSGDNLVVSGNDVIFKLVDTDETVTGVLSVGTTITLTAKTTTATTTETEKFTVTKLTAQAAATNPTNDHIQGIYMGTIQDGDSGEHETIAIYLERGATTTNIYIVAEGPVTLSSATFSVDDDEHVILNFAGNSEDGAFTGVMNFGIHGDAISMRINQNNDEFWVQGLRRVF